LTSRGSKNRSILTHVASKLLNTGFKVRLASGSDFDCLSRSIGSARTLALIEGELSYEAFLEALRKGRTVLTNAGDDWMDLKIDGARLGGEVTASAGESLRVELHSDLPLDEVEIIVNGKVVKTVRVAPGRQVTRLDMTFDTSSWILARTLGTLTGPIYVIVDGNPIRASAADACYLMRYVDHLSDQVKKGTIDLGTDKGAALSAYSEARAEFSKRWKQSGGVTCK